MSKPTTDKAVELVHAQADEIIRLREHLAAEVARGETYRNRALALREQARLWRAQERAANDELAYLKDAMILANTNTRNLQDALKTTQRDAARLESELQNERDANAGLQQQAEAAKQFHEQREAAHYQVGYGAGKMQAEAAAEAETTRLREKVKTQFDIASGYHRRWQKAAKRGDTYRNRALALMRRGRDCGQAIQMATARMMKAGWAENDAIKRADAAERDAARLRAQNAAALKLLKQARVAVKGYDDYDGADELLVEIDALLAEQDAGEKG